MKGMGQGIGLAIQAEGHSKREILKCLKLNYSSLEEATRMITQLKATDPNQQNSHS